MKKETLVWQTIVLILGLLLIVTIREYLLDKNEIESEIGEKNCHLQYKKADLGTESCQDIGAYKLKFNK